VPRVSLQASLLDGLNDSPARSPVRSPVSLSPAVTGSGGDGGLLPHFDDHPVLSPSVSRASSAGAESQLLIDVDFPSPTGAAVAAATTNAGTSLLPPTRSVSIDDLLGGLNLSAPSSGGSGQLRTVHFRPQPHRYVSTHAANCCHARQRSAEVLQATQAPTIVMSHKHNGNLDFSNFNFPPHLGRDLGTRHFVLRGVTRALAHTSAHDKSRQTWVCLSAQARLR
jgi:hypothetical protein